MLTLTKPFANAVYQRDNQNTGVIPIAGQTRPNTDVTITLTPTLSGEATSLVVSSDSNGTFSGGISAVGGTYQVTISAGAETATLQAGIGEVFILWGHSFMQWKLGSAAQNPNVFTLSDTLAETNYQFERLTNRVGPFLPDGAGFAGMLGDKLVARLGVPVLFYNTAFGGTNIDQNYKVLTGEPFAHSFIKYADRQPYRPLEKVMQTYLPETGARAILAEHGYNDKGLTGADFSQKFRYVIDYTRNQFGHSDLAFVIVQEETTGQTDRLGNAEIGSAQKTLISSTPNVWQGPDFNAGYWGNPGLHDADAHLTVTGQAQFASDWDASLTGAFFGQSIPVLPDVAITATVEDFIYERSPVVATPEVDYILYGLAALFLLGLLNSRFRARSGIVLLLFAAVLIYRKRQQG
ncbi:hypothetical protein GCM10028807_49910 [Spirosoma daeguense]